MGAAKVGEGPGEAHVPGELVGAPGLDLVIVDAGQVPIGIDHQVLVVVDLVVAVCALDVALERSVGVADVQAPVVGQLPVDGNRDGLVLALGIARVGGHVAVVRDAERDPGIRVDARLIETDGPVVQRVHIIGPGTPWISGRVHPGQAVLPVAGDIGDAAAPVGIELVVQGEGGLQDIGLPGVGIHGRDVVDAPVGVVVRSPGRVIGPGGGVQDIRDGGVVAPAVVVLDGNRALDGAVNEVGGVAGVVLAPVGLQHG